jgi:hypothetical protein
MKPKSGMFFPVVLVACTLLWGSVSSAWAHTQFQPLTPSNAGVATDVPPNASRLRQTLRVTLFVVRVTVELATALVGGQEQSQGRLTPVEKQSVAHAEFD